MLRLIINDQDLTSGIVASGEMLRVHGVEVVIENQKGSVRRGVGADGEPWVAVLAADYGYVRGRGEGGDGEPLDCFVGPDPESDRVFVVRQVDPATGDLDEHKILFGYQTFFRAMADYVASYSDDPWPRVGGVREMSMQEFRRWAPET